MEIRPILGERELKRHLEREKEIQQKARLIAGITPNKQPPDPESKYLIHKFKNGFTLYDEVPKVIED